MDRKQEIASAVSEIRIIEKEHGVTRESLGKIKERLIRLARPDLFPASDFPPPAPGGKLKSCLYRVSEDPDHRYALYVNSSLGGHGTPAHNHTTWAVIVGITGEELNRFYDRSPEGPPRQKGETVVKQGTGVCFLPDDLHSIQIQAPLVNFHMYGLALDQLHSREYYQAAESTWKVFPAHGDIREAR
jgi:predicted metal-dependent enzyme (double-stranded beta helix superfamily)